MRKVFFLPLLAFLALLSACNVKIDAPDNPVNADPAAVGFNVYVNRGLQTKAGYAGELTTATLSDAAGGFGVFAYYGDGVLYNETLKPDFMYNQQVTYNSTYRVWEYKPLKYWPNEYGDAAGSQSADRLSFFAYAPYVDVTPSTGIVKEEGETGILGMSRNISPGDPMVMYGSSFTPGTGVDLCWGVAKEDFFSSVDGTNNHVNQGEPFINVVKPKTGDHLKYEFNHALTQLNVTVDADIDASDTLAADTKIFVRSITFTGFTTRGSLNLNSKAGSPAWFDIAGTGRLNREPVTIFDGRSDGQEGVASAADVNEMPQGLNPNIIQKGVSTTGVTNEPVNLFANAEAIAPVMVIPVAGVPVSVTIVYDIETADPNLAGFLSDGATRGVSVENRITRTIKMDDGSDLTLLSGRRYVINLHLGLTSVKFEAEAADWENVSHAGTAYLPENASSLGSVILTDADDHPVTSMTVWKNATITTPKVTVLDASGTDITSAVSLSWTSGNTDVATVNASTGAVSLVDAGEAAITVTATLGEFSASKSYTIYVNKVTSISVSPTSAEVLVGNTIPITASLTTTTYGAASSLTLPTINWLSLNTDRVTVSPTTGTATQATGVAVGTVSVTAWILAEYMIITPSVSNTAVCNVTVKAPSQNAFRGYEVSPGILYRDASGNYGMTSIRDGSNYNEFELMDSYYGQKSSYDITVGDYTYYFQWQFLKGDNELGADGNIIDADSPKLPLGWVLPTGDTWQTILFGEPKASITVNGKQLHGKNYIQGPDHDQHAGAYAFVRIQSGTKYYNGILLFKDGVTVSCDGLNVDKIGTVANFEDNTLTMSQFDALKSSGCFFIPETGYYSPLSGYGWRDINEGHYHAADTDGWGKSYYLYFLSGTTIGGTYTSSPNEDYIPVRLVRLATDN